MSPLPADFIHIKVCKPICAKLCNRQIIGYIDAREIMEVAEHNGKFCNIPKHGRK